MCTYHSSLLYRVFRRNCAFFHDFSVFCPGVYVYSLASQKNPPPLKFFPVFMFFFCGHLSFIKLRQRVFYHSFLFSPFPFLFSWIFPCFWIWTKIYISMILPSLPRHHWTNFRSENGQPMGMTIHSHCVVNFDNLLQRRNVGEGGFAVDFGKKHKHPRCFCI